MKLIVGNYYTIGEEYAEKYYYKRFVGSKVSFMKMDRDLAFVKIVLLPPDKQVLSCYVGESIMVHMDDILPYTEEVSSEESEVLPELDQIIEIDGKFADKMGYEAFVGRWAVVKEILSAICEVELVTGESFDIHREDVKFIEQASEGNCYALVDLTKGDIYYTKEIEEFKALRQLARKNSVRFHTRVGRDLTDIIDSFPNCSQFHPVKGNVSELNVKIFQ